MKMENVSKIKCIPFLLKYHVLVFIDSDYIYSLKHLTVNAIRLYFHKLYFQQIFSVIKSRTMPPVFPNDEAIASNLIDLVEIFPIFNNHFKIKYNLKLMQMNLQFQCENINTY